MKLYMLERRCLPNGKWQEVGRYSTWRALQEAQKRDQRRSRSDPHEWQVTQLAQIPELIGNAVLQAMGIKAADGDVSTKGET